MQVRNITTASIAHITAIASAAGMEERAIVQALPALQAQFRGWDREDIKATIMVNYAAVVGVELKVQGSGRIVWPAEAGTAKKACNRLITRIMGDAVTEKQEVEVPEELLIAARKLAKLAQQYEGARGLASKALAQAFAE